MRHLDARISEWRKDLAASGSIGRDSLRELESHLLDVIDEELEGGADLDTAFATAVAQVGSPEELSKEFHKVYPEFSWAKRFVWMLSGYALISMAVLLIGTIRLSVEYLLVRWQPSSMLPIPGTDGQVHISVIASLLAMAIATCLCVWVGIRIVRGRSRLFDRYFANCAVGKSLIFLLVAFNLLVVVTGSHATLFWLKLRFAIENQFEETFGSSIQSNASQLVAMWAGTLAALVAIGVSIWAVLLIRKQPQRKFVAWMIGGYFAINLIGFLAKIAATLLGLTALWIKGDFAAVVNSKEGYGFVVFFAAVARAALCLALAIFAVRVACGRPSPRTESLFSWCWRRAPYLIALWAAALLVKQLVSHLHVVSGVPIFGGGWAVEALLLYSQSNGYLLSRLGLLFALPTIWFLFREQRNRNHPNQIAPA